VNAQRGAALWLAGAALAGCASLPEVARFEASVRETEIAFAHTMATRDFPAFQDFLSADAVFLSGAETLRGRAAIAAAWRPLFEGPVAPFDWQPDSVRVLASGDLALSGGPVTGPKGESFGRFSSVWRRERNGRWRIVFDSGEAPCPCRTPP
jgi:ketosteroid isomerase-like protein